MNKGDVIVITREMVYELSEALDPEHQGEQWPDPIKWDGQPLKEQGGDLLVLADAELDDHKDDRAWWDARLKRIAAAAQAVREAIA